MSDKVFSVLIVLIIGGALVGIVFAVLHDASTRDCMTPIVEELVRDGMDLREAEAVARVRC